MKAFVFLKNRTIYSLWKRTLNLRLKSYAHFYSVNFKISEFFLLWNDQISNTVPLQYIILQLSNSRYVKRHHMMVSEKKCDNFMWSNIFENGYAKPIFCNTFFEKCAKNFIFGNGCYLLYYYPQLLESIYSHNLIAFQCDKIFNFQGKIHKTFRILDLKIPYFSFVKDNSLQKMLI